MSLFTGRPFSRPQAAGQQLDTSLSVSDFDSSTALQVASAHKTLDALTSAGIENQHPGPRELMRLSRLLYQNVSLYNRAIDIHTNLVGRVYVPKEAGLSNRAMIAADQVCKRLPILSELQPTISDVRGISNLSRMMVISMLRDGMAFAQDRFALEGAGLSDRHLGAMFFDSAAFGFDLTPTGVLLNYRDLQYPRLNEEGQTEQSPFFHVAKLESAPNDPWGVPLIEGGSLLVQTFITLLVAIQLQTMRFANPASMTLIQQKNLDAFKGGDLAKLFATRIKDLKKSVNQALREMRMGKAVELVSSLPGEVSLSSKIFGEGFNNFVDHETLWKISVLFCAVLNVPPALVGVKVGGGGIGSDEFIVSYRLLVSRVAAVRETIRPILAQIIRNVLATQGIGARDLERVDVAFGDLDLVSAKDAADIGKKQAETLQTLTAIYTEIAAVDPERAEQFAEENGLGNLVGG